MGWKVITAVLIPNWPKWFYLVKAAAFRVNKGQSGISFKSIFLQVCDEVTEITCEIVPYTDCEMSMEETPYKSFETITKQFQKKTCKEGMDVVQHTKMMPECRNVTKQNCITKWETDENGNQASDTFFFLPTNDIFFSEEGFI